MFGNIARDIGSYVHTSVRMKYECFIGSLGLCVGRLLITYQIYCINKLEKMKKCEHCPKQAFFSCSRCEKVYYCSKNHQIEHWKTAHKFTCEIIPPQPKQPIHILLKKRYISRKQYFENYSSKNYEICLLDSKALIQFQKSIKELTNNKIDEFEYGGSVCLLIRTLCLIKNEKKARLTLQNYLAEKGQYLSSFDDVPNIENFTVQEKELFHKKMGLISTIANLCYILQMDCVKYYVIYIKNVEKLYGKSSIEASNTYFLLGCYFSEEGYFKKAISCFMKSAYNRDILAGDCYFNIGVLYNLQDKYVEALQMFEQALEYRLEQRGQDAQQIAEIYENTGQIYVKLNDFITALLEYEKSFKIRSTNMISPEYGNLIDLIHQLYDKLCYFIQRQQDSLKKPSIYYHLKTKIEEEEIYWKEGVGKKMSFKRQNIQIEPPKEQSSKQKQREIIEKVRELKSKEISIANQKQTKSFVETPINKILSLSQDLLESFNQRQLFLLSELQIELQSCKTMYSTVYTIGKSAFIRNLSSDKLKILEMDNRELFEDIDLEGLRIDHKRQPFQ